MSTCSRKEPSQNVEAGPPSIEGSFRPRRRFPREAASCRVHAQIPRHSRSRHAPQEQSGDRPAAPRPRRAGEDAGGAPPPPIVSRRFRPRAGRRPANLARRRARPSSRTAARRAAAARSGRRPAGGVDPSAALDGEQSASEGDGHGVRRVRACIFMRNACRRLRIVLAEMESFSAISVSVSPSAIRSGAPSPAPTASAALTRRHDLLVAVQLPGSVVHEGLSAGSPRAGADGSHARLPDWGLGR
jgi:hypothetical protein